MHEYRAVPDYPFILASHSDWIVVYKPRGMHSSAHGSENHNILITWAVSKIPELKAVKGYWEHDFGLLHRLDKETAGLLLIARTQAFFDFHAQQKTASLTKLYTLVAVPQPYGLPGSFPRLYAPPGLDSEWLEALHGNNNERICSLLQDSITSYFRAYGPERKAVACCAPEYRSQHKQKWTHELYATHIVSALHDNGHIVLNVRLDRGFRHQIRAHCAWVGLPLIGDKLYNPRVWASDELSLVAYGLEFIDLEEKMHTIVL